jgi:DNA repair protein RecO (recombination protein O)
MLNKTRGIILHTVKYGDNSLILTVYTEKFGRQPYIINSARNSRSKNKAGLLQPLFIVDLEVYQKKGRDLQRIKEIKLSSPYTTIPFDVIKTTQVIFIAGILYKTIIEEEQNPELFHFIESSLMFFDMMHEGKSDFHIWFLSHLTNYLGIVPNTSEIYEGWLDMKKGTMVVSEPPHPGYMNQTISSLFKELLKLKIQDLPVFKTTRENRTQLLSKILEYYQIHFGNVVSLKSSEILKEVFH